MISLQQSMKDIDEAEALHRAAAKAFAGAMETSAEHVVEVNRHDAAAFREQVLGLAGRLGHSNGTEDLVAAHTTFRSELRQYSDKASQHVSRLREELEAAATAMQAFAQGVSTGSGEHETVLRREFGQLRQATGSEDIGHIRDSVRQTLHTVTESYEGLKQAHNLVIAQLRDEIRVLQSELQRSQHKPAIKEGFVERHAVDKQVEDLLQQKRSFGVILLGLPEQEQLYRKYPRDRVTTALEELETNLGSLARPARPAVWSAGVYALIAPANVQPEEWRRKLTTCHIFQMDGLPRTLKIEPRVEIVQSAPGESPALFFSRLSHAVEVVSDPKRGH